MSDETQRKANGPLERVVDVLVYLPVGLVLELPAALPRCIARGREELGVLVGAPDAGTTRGPRLNLERIVADARGAVRGLARAVDRDEEESSAVPSGAKVPVSEREVQARPPGVDASGLAIPDYESLSASQVVKRLEGLSADELEAVRVYEEATRGRRTVLGKITQLQGA